VNFVISAIVVSHLPKGNDSPSQDVLIWVFLFFHQNNPIFAFGKAFD
jgi:hypothetical protein